MPSPKENSLWAGPGPHTQTDRSQILLLVYEDLRRLANRHLRRQKPGHTLQTTALVHEAYLRLAGQKGIRWVDRSHVLAVAAKAMRSVLVDHARCENAAKRRGGNRMPLDEAAFLNEERDIDLVALDEALDKLARIDPEKGRLVELHFFGGLTLEEVSRLLGISLSTAKRNWRFAKGWLYRELTKPERHER